MNTKQLWFALSHNCNTNPYFDGIYSIDTLKDIKEKPELIICNTDPSGNAGKHWVLFFFDSKQSVDFYDSLGRDISYYGVEFLDLIKKFAVNVTQCYERTQPVNSSLCEQYCLFYAFEKCTKKYNMEKIVENMNSVDCVLQLVKEKYYCEPYHKCSLLQECINF